MGETSIEYHINKADRKKSDQVGNNCGVCVLLILLIINTLCRHLSIPMILENEETGRYC